jgi:hypothetical protein
MSASKGFFAPPVSLLGALELAAHYRERLVCFCERIELTGLLRRRRFNWLAPSETRIEFLVIPRLDRLLPERTGLPECRRDALQAAVTELVARKEFSLAGPEAASARRGCHRLINETCELVLWKARPRNFGSLWVWRTGSQAHTAWLCERARRRRVCWLPRTGLCTGLRACGADEEALYHGLGLRFIPPEAREAGCYEGGQFELGEEAGQ